MVTVIIGFASGILSGMGVGGGMILIPALSLLEGVEQHLAQSINLFYFIPTSAAALAVHTKNKNVDYKCALKIVAGGILPAIIGAYSAVNVPSELLKRIFAVFICVFGVREIVLGMKNS